jgi:Putative phage tail protein
MSNDQIIIPEVVSGESGIFGGGGSGGLIAPNTARSRSFLSVIFLIGQGQIEGFNTSVDVRKKIYFDRTPLMNPNGTFNFNDVWIDYRPGVQAQTPISLAATGQGAPTTVNQLVSFNGGPIVRTPIDPNASKIKVSIYTPGFSTSDTQGNVTGATVNFQILLATNGGAYIVKATDSFSFKTAGGYIRDYTINVNPGDTWQVAVQRLTADATSTYVADKIYWQSYTTITTQVLRYLNWALLSFRIDASYFAQAPKLSLNQLQGKIVRIPNNYNPITRVYTGFWSGVYAFAYTNNPAWILLDYLTNTRYGLGYPLSKIDTAALYQIAKYNDQFVDNAHGGFEPRYQFHAYIRESSDAWDAINAILGSMHCLRCQKGNLVSFIQDRPGTPTADLFTNSNVITKYDESGKMVHAPFTYSRTGLSAQHSVCLVKWANPNNFGQIETAYVDLTAIGYGAEMATLGIKQAEIAPLGCTSEAQALRYGRWLLATERLENETVVFSVGSQGLLREPGEIVQIGDTNRATNRGAGRIVAATATTVTLDAPTAITGGDQLQVLINQVVVTVSILNGTGTYTIVSISPAFTTIPVVNAIWQIPGNNTNMYRIISVEDNEDGSYGLTGLLYDPLKFTIADTLQSLDNVNFTDHQPPKPPTNLFVRATYRGYALGWLASVSKNVIKYRVQAQAIGSGLWVEIPMVDGHTDVDVSIYSDKGHIFQVAAVNIYNKRSDWASTADNHGRMGLILAKYENGSIRLDRTVELLPTRTYYIYTQCQDPPADRPEGLPRPYPDFRQIKTPAGVTNVISVAQNYLGDEMFLFGTSTYGGGLGVANNFQGNYVNGKIRYVNVTGVGIATVHDLENQLGKSVRLVPGSYTVGEGELANFTKILSCTLSSGITAQFTQHVPGQNPVDGSSWRIVADNEMPPPTGIVTSRNTDGSITLDQNVTFLAGVTYYIYTRCFAPPGNPGGLPIGYLDRRRIVNLPSTTNLIRTSLDYLGNRSIVWGDRFYGAGMGIVNNFNGSSIDGKNVYVIVSGVGTVDVYDQENLVGNTASLPAGVYSVGVALLGLFAFVASARLDPGITMQLCQFNPGANPQANSPWWIDTV